ncbi:MAG TPA: glycosyl hydrolase family 8, partial [Clostridium sp.]
MERNKSISLRISTIILVGIVTIFFTMPYLKKINSDFVWKDNSVSTREEALLEFINTKLMDNNHGIKTNFKDKESEGDITKGNSILSESEGMMLLYYIDRD